MKTFKTKTETFNHIKRKFSRYGRTILVRGSTAYGEVKSFSDFDVEVYGGKLNKPYYEIDFLNHKPVLISVYFYRYSSGKKIKPEKNVRVLYGEYNENLKPDFSREKYSLEQKIRRECQMVVDSLFSYLRHRDKKDLGRVQKRI